MTLVFKGCHFWIRVMLEIFVKRKRLYILRKTLLTPPPLTMEYIHSCLQYVIENPQNMSKLLPHRLCLKMLIKVLEPFW